MKEEGGLRFAEAGKLSSFIDNDITQPPRLIEREALFVLTENGNYSYSITVYDKRCKQIQHIALSNELEFCCNKAAENFIWVEHAQNQQTICKVFDFTKPVVDELNLAITTALIE